MSIDALTASLKLQMTWDARDNVQGSQPVSHNETLVKTLSLGTSQSPTTAGGADECIFLVRYISTGGTDTLDLSAALTNVVRDSAVTLVRIKTLAIVLFGTGDQQGAAGVTVTGTACTGIKVGGEGTHPWKGPFTNTADQIEILNDGFAALGTRGPLGYNVSSGMNDKLLITNLDASVTAVYGIGILGGGS